MRKAYRYIFYAAYMLIFRFTPDAYRPYALFFPWIRRKLAQHFLLRCGQNINIGSGASFSPDVCIGDNSDLGSHCLVQGNVEIGKDVMMAPDVKVFTRNHRFDRLDIPMNQQGEVSYKTIIGDDVWIGSNAVILPGRKIGHHSIVGAGSIVTKDVPDYAIVVGNPARIIRYRNENAGHTQPHDTRQE